MPPVPKTPTTLLKFATVMRTISTMRLRFESLSSTGLARAAAGRRVDPQRDRERQKHQQEQRAGDRRGVDRDALEQERQDEGQVGDRHDHQQDHQAHGERQIAFGDLRELREERRAGGCAEQKETDAERLVEPQQPGQPDRSQRHQHEIGHERQRDEPALRSGARI